MYRSLRSLLRHKIPPLQWRGGQWGYVRMAKWKSRKTNSSSGSSTQLMSLLMQKSSTCSLDQSATVPASFRVRTPTPTTPDSLGPTPSPLLALPPTHDKRPQSVHEVLDPGTYPTFSADACAAVTCVLDNHCVHYQSTLP